MCDKSKKIEMYRKVQKIPPKNQQYLRLSLRSNH